MLLYNIIDFIKLIKLLQKKKKNQTYFFDEVWYNKVI